MQQHGDSSGGTKYKSDEVDLSSNRPLNVDYSVSTNAGRANSRLGNESDQKIDLKKSPFSVRNKKHDLETNRQ